MTEVPAEVRRDAKDILDRWAGRTHTEGGPVVRCLDEILAVVTAGVRAKVAEEILRNSRGTPVWQAATEEAAEIALGEQP